MARSKRSDRRGRKSGSGGDGVGGTSAVASAGSLSAPSRQMGLVDVSRENTCRRRRKARLSPCFDVLPGFNLHLSPPEGPCSPVNLDVCRPTESCAANVNQKVENRTNATPELP